MSDKEVEGWLNVALGEVVGYPAAALWHAATEAKRSCTHHAQIIPALIASAESWMAEQRRYDEITAPLPKALPKPRMSDEEFARIVENRGIALSAHLDRGTIISNGDGTFRRPDEAA